MSRDVIELALRRHFRRDADPNASALQLLAQYDADRQSDALSEAEVEIALAIDRCRDEFPDTDVMRTRRLGMRAAERVVQGVREEIEKGGEKSSREADATPKAPEPRIERYIAALRSADKYALVGHRDDLTRFAEAVIAVANDETDPVYRDGYATGRTHAGADGFRFRDFTPVFTTSDGSDCPATELRCVLCGDLVQGVGPHTLLDLMALAAQHDCQTTRKDGRS